MDRMSVYDRVHIGDHAAKGSCGHGEEIGGRWTSAELWDQMEEIDEDQRME